MKPEDTQAGKTPPDDQKEKKARQRVELPTRLSDGTVLAELSIPQLLDKRAAWESDIALQEQRQLELRAIRAEIRRKA